MLFAQKKKMFDPEVGLRSNSSVSVVVSALTYDSPFFDAKLHRNCVCV